jgi:hypothetical protein
VIVGDADLHTAASDLLDAWEWQPGQPLGQPGTVAKRIMDAVEALRAALAAGPIPDPQGADEPKRQGPRTAYEPTAEDAASFARIDRLIDQDRPDWYAAVGAPDEPTDDDRARSPQAEHLRLIAKDLRSAGDVQMVELSERGVTRSYVTLADELWLIALQLDGRLDVSPGEGGDDG